MCTILALINESGFSEDPGNHGGFCVVGCGSDFGVMPSLLLDPGMGLDRLGTDLIQSTGLIVPEMLETASPLLWMGSGLGH